MGFSERLNAYIGEIGCTARDLANESGISAAAISRYRTGERVPSVEGRHLRSLAFGISELSEGTLTGEEVLAELAHEIDGISVPYDSFLINFDTLLRRFGITYNELARSLNFDPSYISRIVSGQRRPTDVRALINGTARYIAHRCVAYHQLSELEAIVEIPEASLSDEGVCASHLADWLAQNEPNSPSKSVGKFLETLDGFNIDSFIRSLSFGEVELEGNALGPESSKNFTGLSEMMECEMRFLKTVLSSNSTQELTMYSDMPIVEMAGDGLFPKEWMLGIAMILKRGIAFNMIHDTSRPLNEMMIGLESWVPMYMTGLISPYYLDRSQSDVFCHILKVAGSVVMSGEAIAGYQNEGRYFLSTCTSDVSFYRKKAMRLLEKAHPLMRIFNAAKRGAYEAFMESRISEQRDWRIESCQPLPGLLSKELLEDILEGNDLPESDSEALFEYADEQGNAIAAALESSSIELRMPVVEQLEFDKFPLSLDFSSMFYEGDVKLSYEQYSRAMEQISQYAESNNRFTFCESNSFAFRNMTISLYSNELAIVSKSKAPAIHFVIEHPALIDAIARFSAPLVE